jgi:hypothetical protein
MHLDADIVDKESADCVDNFDHRTNVAQTQERAVSEFDRYSLIRGSINATTQVGRYKRNRTTSLVHWAKCRGNYHQVYIRFTLFTRSSRSTSLSTDLVTELRKRCGIAVEMFRFLLRSGCNNR